MLYRCIVVVVAVTACAGPEGKEGPQGPAGGDGAGTPSISAITPRHAFLGRTVEVQISGDNTAFDATTTVDAGAGITVSAVRAASPTLVIASLTIDDDAATGDRDVTVHTGATTSVATAGLSLDPSLVFSPVAGPLLQGDIATVEVINLDTIAFANPPGVTSVPGAVFIASAVDPEHIEYLSLVDVDAAPGPRTFAFDDDTFLQTRFVADQQDVTIGARTPTSITLPYSSSVVFDTRSKVFAVQTSALGILSARATNIGSGLFASALLSNGSALLADFGQINNGVARVTRATVTTTDVIVGGNRSIGSDAAHTLTLGVVHTPVSALTPESASSHTLAAPQTVTGPMIIDATLATTTEQDAYSISVPSGASLELIVESPAYAVTITQAAPTSGSIPDFMGPQSFHFTNASGSAVTYTFAIQGQGSATSYTISFRTY